MNIKCMILEFPTVQDLEKEANNLVSKGFKTIGCVSVTCNGLNACTLKLYGLTNV
ncbi:MAG: hypothetical protein NE327_18090 [Lentisphaeraceae bacterium]|nr:hypothetical protein [Lentisphaeraceae bacterium]